jgi:flagellar biosynthetic protein FlhB
LAESAGEKSEKATPRKREDERKEGNIFQSKEIVICVTMIVSFLSFKLLYSTTENSLVNCMRQFLQLTATQDTINADDTKNFLIICLKCIAIAGCPILLIVMLAAIISTVAQTKGLFNFKQLKPKFSRMDPLKGFKNLFSLRSILEILKATFKILILFYVIYSFVKDNLFFFAKLMNVSIEAAVPEVGSICFSLIKKITIAFAVIAIIDFMYQKFDYEKKLRMTKQEVKDEYKNTEGNPQIKGKIKQRQQNMAKQRMIQAVPSADVIIRNPTHVAVALKYDKEKNHAPIVVAKGIDELALRIVAIAKENNVYICENIPLARALCAQVNLDCEIPAEFYQAVAEIIAVLYKNRDEQLI